MSKLLRIGVLASGGGTNLQAIIDRCLDGSLAAQIAVVITNNPGAGALDRASKAGIETLCINHRDFAQREDFDHAVVKALQDAEVDLVVLAGFMRILTEDFVRSWRDRMLNIHPALLPAFPGINCHARAIEMGVRITGCTVHFCRPELDNGPIVTQAAVPVLPDDTEETLAARILEAEHVIYPLAVKLIAEGRVRVINEKVRIMDAAYPETEKLVSPVAG